jgi:hypothetical protein
MGFLFAFRKENFCQSLIENPQGNIFTDELQISLFQKQIQNKTKTPGCNIFFLV